jgi:type IV secretion system protein VirB2
MQHPATAVLPTARVTPRMLGMLLSVAVVLAATLLPELAFAAASTDRVETGIANLVTLLTAVGIGIITSAIMVAGYKMAFSGARLSDVSNILIGGVLAGGASGLAAWLFAG